MVFPVGRLDKDSQGLIFLTKRCDLVNKILSAGNHHEKEYLVTVDKEITDDFIAGISSGVPMLGIVTKECKAVRESQNVSESPWSRVLTDRFVVCVSTTTIL